MAYETLSDFDCDKTIAVGGIREDKKTGKKYKNPTQLEGYYVGTKTGIENKLNPEKPNSLHIFQTAEGRVGVWGKTDLNQKMGQAKVGFKTLVQFDKMIPTKRKPMFKYIVKQDKDDVNEELRASASEEVLANEAVEDTIHSAASSGEEEVFEEEAALDSEEEALDEPAAAPAKAPKAAQAPSPQRQSAVQGLLAKKTA